MPYLVDGNNLLGSWGGPRGVRDRRGEVVRRVAAFCRARGARAVVVFDGGPLRPDLATQDLGLVSVRTPPHGEDADGLIRRLIRAATNPAELTVVTSDKALYSYARTFGAHIMRAHEWNTLDRRPPPHEAEVVRKPDREDDVEGWLRQFTEGRPLRDVDPAED